MEGPAPHDVDDDTKVRAYAIERALELAKYRSAKEEPTDMSDNDVIEAARKIDEFLDEG